MPHNLTLGGLESGSISWSCGVSGLRFCCAVQSYYGHVIYTFRFVSFCCISRRSARCCAIEFDIAVFLRFLYTSRYVLSATVRKNAHVVVSI